MDPEVTAYHLGQWLPADHWLLQSEEDQTADDGQGDNGQGDQTAAESGGQGGHGGQGAQTPQTAEESRQGGESTQNEAIFCTFLFCECFLFVLFVF